MFPELYLRWLLCRRARSPCRGVHGEGDREWSGTSVLQLGIELPRSGRVPEPRDQEFAVEEEFLGQFAVEVEFQLLDRDGFAEPGLAIDLHELGEVLHGEALQAAQVEILRTRHPAQRALDTVAAAVNPVDNPFENAHILAETRPEEAAVGAFSEPVHPEEPGRVGELA